VVDNEPINKPAVIAAPDTFDTDHAAIETATQSNSLISLSECSPLIILGSAVDITLLAKIVSDCLAAIESDSCSNVDHAE